MKKIFTLIASVIFVCTFSYGQSQRLVLCEEFTQASCPPCASQNPGYNALLNANPTKVVSIKYQTSWPGVDPMNAQNPSQVATRVSYYSITGVPDGLFDGVHHAGPNYLGAPANATQAMINTEYAVPSPFTITLSHYVSLDNDSVYATATITCSQAVSGTLKAHIVVIERDIYFTTAPGSNGETQFEGVMKKMLPSDQGTTLPASWTVGQQQIINVSWAMTNVYNLNQLAVVAFVQNDVDKSVKQAAFSAPSTVVNYAGVTAITVPTFQCSATLTPSVTIQNLGSATLTSATINYKVDNNTVSTTPWTGSLATNATASVTLPSLTVSPGGHTFNSYITNPNIISTNSNAMSFNITVPFSIAAAPVAAPVVEGYQMAAFPPANWIRLNADNGPTWTRITSAGGFGNSTASARMDFYTSGAGNIDELVMPYVDLTSTSSSVLLTFSVAYAQYTSENDRLEILASTDCGLTWVPTTYNLSGAALSTHIPVGNNTVFVPTAADWRSESVGLGAFTGSNVLIKFKATSDYGNDLYIDDINLSYLTGIAQPTSTIGVEVYPNPSNGIVNVSLNLESSQQVLIKIYNSLGEVVVTKEIGSAIGGIYPLNLSGMASGNYVVQVLSDKNNSLHKITLNK